MIWTNSAPRICSARRVLWQDIRLQRNLCQAGVPFSLTRRHVLRLLSDEFRRELERFVAVCRVVKGLRKVRIGAVGARPGAFNTVRYKRENPATPLASARHDRGPFRKFSARRTSWMPPICASRNAWKKSARAPTRGRCRPTSSRSWLRWASCFRTSWPRTRLGATAIQCWTSVQQNYGCNVCTSMST